MSDLYGEHALRDTRGFQYIKEFAGICFQSVVIDAVFIALNMVMAVFLEHFTKQVEAGGNSVGDLMALGLKIAVFKPASVYGMVLLFAALRLKIVPKEGVKEAGSYVSG